MRLTALRSSAIIQCVKGEIMDIDSVGLGGIFTVRVRVRVRITYRLERVKKILK